LQYFSSQVSASFCEQFFWIQIAFLILSSALLRISFRYITEKRNLPVSTKIARSREIFSRFADPLENFAGEVLKIK